MPLVDATSSDPRPGHVIWPHIGNQAVEFGRTAPQAITTATRSPDAASPRNQPSARPAGSSPPMSARRSHHGPGPAPDKDQATPHGTSSPRALVNAQSEPDPAERLAYSIDEAAHLTGLSRDLLYDEMRRGNLTYVKVGRRRLITRHHLQEFLGDAPS
jgi:excisionase family DNA binding protein